MGQIPLARPVSFGNWPGIRPTLMPLAETRTRPFMPFAELAGRESPQNRVSTTVCPLPEAVSMACFAVPPAVNLIPLGAISASEKPLSHRQPMVTPHRIFIKATIFQTVYLILTAFSSNPQLIPIRCLTFISFRPLSHGAFIFAWAPSLYFKSLINHSPHQAGLQSALLLGRHSGRSFE